jgi:predicted metal-dependent phosphoesterase TrpH
MGKADLHIHSSIGDGLASVEEILDWVENETDLDLISITDHDDLTASMIAREIASRRNYRFDFIAGMEITTRAGHLLAYGLERPVRMLMPLERSIDAVHAQGGVCLVPHPMSWLTRSIGQRRLMAMNNGSLRADGIELLNPSVAGRVSYQKAIDMNREILNLAEVAGSDAHSLSLIGSAYTEFPGHTAEEFLQALADHKTEAKGQFWTFAEHYEIAGRQMLRSMVITPSHKVGRAIGQYIKHKREIA